MRHLLQLFLALCLSWQVQAQGKFTIDGKIPALKNNSKVYLVYPVGDEMITDSTIVQLGRFSFEGTVAYPAQASVFLDKNPYTAKLAQGEQIDYLRFYLESAEMKISGKDSLGSSVVSGSPTNKEHKALQAMLRANSEQFAALKAEFQALPAEQREDSAILSGFIDREKELMADMGRTQLRFAEHHPNSYISVVCLSVLAAQPEFSNGVAAAYAKLSDALRQSPLAKDVPVKLAAQEKTKNGAVAPDFSERAPDGKEISLSDFRGKYVLLDFWASWCGPCRTENPSLVSAQNRFAGKGFTVFGVSLDQPGQRKAWLSAIEKDGLTWPQVADLKGWNSDVAKLYGIQSIPANFLIDPDGKIIDRNLRGNALLEKLTEILGK